MSAKIFHLAATRNGAAVVRVRAIYGSIYEIWRSCFIRIGRSESFHSTNRIVQWPNSTINQNQNIVLTTPFIHTDSAINDPFIPLGSSGSMHLESAQGYAQSIMISIVITFSFANEIEFSICSIPWQNYTAFAIFIASETSAFVRLHLLNADLSLWICSADNVTYMHKIFDQGFEFFNIQKCRQLDSGDASSVMNTHLYTNWAYFSKISPSVNIRGKKLLHSQFFLDSTPWWVYSIV